MSFKVFCAEKTSDKGGGAYFQGWTKQFGMITVFEGTREKDGTPLLIVNIARPWRKRRGGSFKKKRTYTRRRKY